jgi:hypothetical protein
MSISVGATLKSPASTMGAPERNSFRAWLFKRLNQDNL